MSMKSSRVVSIAAAVVLAAFVDGAAHARIYKCTDASGKVTYSDIACAPADRPDARAAAAASPKVSAAIKASGVAPCQDAPAAEGRDDCRRPPAIPSARR
jgi:hypothetical protein